MYTKARIFSIYVTSSVTVYDVWLIYNGVEIHTLRSLLFLNSSPCELSAITWYWEVELEVDTFVS